MPRPLGARSGFRVSLGIYGGRAMSLLIRLGDLPKPAHETWSFAPGSFSWVPGGIQWVVVDGANGMPIGKAGVQERDQVLFVDLHFDLERIVAGAFPRTLPSDPAEASKRMRFKWHFKTLGTAKNLITRAEVLSLTINARDPDGRTIGALLDASTKDQDWT